VTDHTQEVVAIGDGGGGTGAFGQQVSVGARPLERQKGGEKGRMVLALTPKSVSQRGGGGIAGDTGRSVGLFLQDPQLLRQSIRGVPLFVEALVRVFSLRL
jgi:hypothetical protein